MASITTTTSNAKKIYKVAIQGGTSATLATADTYVDKNIMIVAQNSGDNTDIAPGLMGTPTATKGTVSNHTVTITPRVTNERGYIEGGTLTGAPVTVSAAELVSGSQTINTNTTTDVTNLKDVVTDVSPLIYVKDITVATDDTRSISFTGLPSEPIAWTLDCATYVTNLDNKYRCISARKDNTGTYTYSIYKRNGNNSCYVYYQTQGFQATYNNGTLTMSATSSGNAEYCGSFLNKTYRLMAVCKNDGRTDVFI